MTRILQIGHLLLLLAGIGAVSIWGVLGWRANQTVTAVNATVKDGHSGMLDVFAESRDVTIAMIGKCKPGKPETCGLVPAVRNMAGTMQEQVAQTEPLVAGAAKALDRTSSHLDKAADALTGTANAATGTLHGASLTLRTLNDSLAATQPLIRDSDGLVKQYSLAAPAVTTTAANVQKMTADGARITKDAADEADRLAHPAKKKLGFWGGFWVGLTYVHKMLPPIF